MKFIVQTILILLSLNQCLSQSTREVIRIQEVQQCVTKITIYEQSYQNCVDFQVFRNCLSPCYSRQLYSEFKDCVGSCRSAADCMSGYIKNVQICMGSSSQILQAIYLVFVILLLLAL